MFSGLKFEHDYWLDRPADNTESICATSLHKVFHYVTESQAPNLKPSEVLFV